MKTGFSDFIIRWRHTLGYGVHSPLAYRIVKECVHPNPEYAMYADDYIDSVYGAGHRKARVRAYMLVRLVNTLLPRSIWMPGGDRHTEDAVRRSFPSIHISISGRCPKNADFIAIFDNTDPHSAWEKMKDSGNACLVSFTGGNIPVSLGSKAPTLILEGRSYSIFIRREGMEQVAYTIL